MFLPHPRVKVSIVGSLRDREVACSASDRQGSNFESCVWRTVSSQSSHHPQEVLLAQFSLYVHKGGLKPDSFHFIIAQTELKAPPQLPEVTFLTHQRTIDKSALVLIPEDQQALWLFPCNVYGDGNCLPRCASLLVYGHENHHLEMRARIIDELVRHEDNYLDDNILSNGCNSSAHRNVAVQFAMFSEKYNTQKLSFVSVQRIFRAEALDLCQSGQYMGVWQMAALANVLKTEVVSVYPLYIGKTMRNDLHRRFTPFRGVELNKAKEVYIMWSNVNGSNIPESDWRPNHFVLLLKTDPEENHPSPQQSYINKVESLSPFFEFEYDDDDSFNLNTSMVNIIMQNLGDDQIIVDCIQNDDQIPDDQATIADCIQTDDQMLDDQATIVDFIQTDDRCQTIKPALLTASRMMIRFKTTKPPLLTSSRLIIIYQTIKPLLLTSSRVMIRCQTIKPPLLTASRLMIRCQTTKPPLSTVSRLMIRCQTTKPPLLTASRIMIRFQTTKPPLLTASRTMIRFQTTKPPLLTASRIMIRCQTTKPPLLTASRMMIRC